MRIQTNSHMTVGATVAARARVAERPVIMHVPAREYPPDVVPVVGMRHAIVVACATAIALAAWLIRSTPNSVRDDSQPASERAADLNNWPAPPV